MMEGDRGLMKLWRGIDGSIEFDIFGSSVHDEDHEETGSLSSSSVQERVTATFIFNFGVARAFGFGITTRAIPLSTARSTFPRPYASLSALDASIIPLPPSCASIASCRASVLLSALR